MRSLRVWPATLALCCFAALICAESRKDEKAIKWLDRVERDNLQQDRENTDNLLKLNSALAQLARPANQPNNSSSAKTAIPRWPINHHHHHLNHHHHHQQQGKFPALKALASESHSQSGPFNYLTAGRVQNGNSQSGRARKMGN